MKHSEFLFYSCCILGGFLIAQQLYTLGYLAGFYNAKDTSYVKKRIVKKGNIIEYPFRTESGKTDQTSDCNSVKQSGQEPEKEGA